MIAARLLEINCRFYADFGRPFSATRRRIQPGVRRILERLDGAERILDLGCGNGELARALTRRGHRGPYIGLDFSPPLLEEARRELPQGFTFIQVDLTSPEWASVISNQLPVTSHQSAITGHFDVVFAFAVLHHIPGSELRLSILRKVHDLLCDDGMFIHSEWQFLNSPRLRARIQPWQAVGLSLQDVDDGDYLLDWRHGGRGLRYVHHFSEAELAALAAASGFRVVETFYSDGEGGGLGVYQVWVREC